MLTFLETTIHTSVAPFNDSVRANCWHLLALILQSLIGIAPAHQILESYALPTQFKPLFCLDCFPSKYIAFSGFICVAINRNAKGENSIQYYNLNHSHFTRPRQHQIELNNGALSRLAEELDEGINAGNPTTRFLARLKSVLQSAQPTEPYSVCIGTALLKSDAYKKIKRELMTKELWSPELKQLEENIDCLV